jgi:hypothetical protein
VVADVPDVLGSLPGRTAYEIRVADLLKRKHLTMPAAAGLLLGSRRFDVGIEWRYPRARGTGQTWSERSLFKSLAFRYW